MAIARALVIRPALILADEPTGMLDRANGQAVTTALRSLVDELGHTLVTVTHDPSMASQATRCITLIDGQIIEATADAVVDRSLTAR